MGNKHSQQQYKASALQNGVHTLPYPEAAGQYVQRPRSRLSVAGYEYCNGGSTTRSNDWIYGSFGAQCAAPPPGTPPKGRGQKTPAAGTADSGYLTSGEAPRQLQRGSRLSLNEAMFDAQQQQQQACMRPMAMGPPGPPFAFFAGGGPPPHVGMEPHMGPGPPPPGAFVPFAPPFGPPPMDPKEAKKWHKKCKKMAKKGSLPKQDPMMFLGPPPMGMPPGVFPHPMGVMLVPPAGRACSVNDLSAAGVATVPQPDANRAPAAGKKYSSTVDLHQQQAATAATASDEHRRPWIAPEFALAGANKRRHGNKAKEAGDTKFEEERPAIGGDDTDSAAMHSPPHRQQALIYESLGKQQQQRADSSQLGSAVVSVRAEINRDASPVDNGDGDSLAADNLPLKVSAEAQAILARNAELFKEIDDEHSGQKTERSVNGRKASDHQSERNITKQQRADAGAADAAGSERGRTVATGECAGFSADDESDSLVSERLIVARPVRQLQQQQAQQRAKAGGDESARFDGDCAWASVDVQCEVQRRLAETGPVMPEVLEERCNVRLARAIRQCSPPRAAIADAENDEDEPIYMGYDERLPEFKKRLIETGAFQHEHDETPETGCWDEENEDSRQTEELNAQAKSSRPAAHKKHKQISDTALQHQSGDVSDIDFSWVHDLESRMRAKPALSSTANFVVTGKAAGEQNCKAFDKQGTLHLMRHGPTGDRPPLHMHHAGAATAAAANGATDTAMPTKYFGMVEEPRRTTAPPPMVSTPAAAPAAAVPQSQLLRDELEPDARSYMGLSTNVRAKAAMFETQARSRERQLLHHAQMPDGRPAERIMPAPYIPAPDYVPSNRLVAGHHPEQYYQQQQQQPQVVMQQQPQQQHRHQLLAVHPANVVYTSDEGGGVAGGGAYSPNSSSAATSNSSSGVHQQQLQQQHAYQARHDRSSRLAAYNVPPNAAPAHSNRPQGSPNQRLQAQRRYDSTEFYRRNMLAQQQQQQQQQYRGKDVDEGVVAAPIWQSRPVPVLHAQAAQARPAYAVATDVNGQCVRM